MGYAGLWTRIYDMDPGCLKQFASFSSRLSLDFEIRLIGTPHDSQIAALSNRYSDRVRSLSLLAPREFPMYYISEFLRNFLGHRASRLRSLELTLLGPYRAEDPYEPLFLGDYGLFAGRVSHLQALSVYCPSGALILQMDCPVFRTLQYLCVASNASWQTSPTIHFMSCLQTWTELRELHLYFGLPTDLTDIPHDISSFLPPFKYESCISLPSIRELHLVDHVRLISNFMAHVSLHPSTVLNFEFIVFDQRIFPETNITRSLAAMNLVEQVSELAGAPPVHVELLCSDSGGTFSAPGSPMGRVQVAWSTVPIPDDDDDDDDDEGPVPQFTLVFLSWGCVITQIASLGLALDTLELSYVKTLALDATEPHFLVDWLPAFTKLQNLRDLRIVEAQRAGRFFKALGIPASPGRACLPKLESMYISVRSMRQSTFDALVKALKDRMDLGSPLPVLRIVMDQNEPLGADREKALAQVVGSMESETADLDFKEEEDEDKKDAGSEANVDGGQGMAEEDEVRTEDAGTQGDDSN
ncbi:hypothetical protein EWM64_g2416 [Hericium alpestre]|uniref:F-box domain-containing protein n=1 Tax=Hericium alpestre TaxID=135208 RepID=A0A4Z0A6R8_9AGAM|nr:hypothetical protein EWM64_g2416 [Hericium alpestre]